MKAGARFYLVRRIGRVPTRHNSSKRGEPKDDLYTDELGDPVGSSRCGKEAQLELHSQDYRIFRMDRVLFLENESCQSWKSCNPVNLPDTYDGQALPIKTHKRCHKTATEKSRPEAAVDTLGIVLYVCPGWKHPGAAWAVVRRPDGAEVSAYGLY